MYKIFLFFSLFFFLNLNAQEFKCKAQVNAESINNSNKQIFKSLERAIEEFVNKNKWTEKKFQNHEKIKCDIVINVKSYNAGKFTAELYFRSYRPTYNATYQTLLTNLIDKNFKFKYQEFQRLDFNIEMFENNLVSSLAFYIYIALGHDFDSFKLNAGKDFYEKAEIIQSNAEQSNIAGWEKGSRKNSKGNMIDLLLNERNQYYHRAVYTYNRWGLDMMTKNPQTGKNNFITAINFIDKLKKENPESDYLIKIFFDAKADEIVQIFSEGPTVNTGFVLSKLRDLAPNYNFKWDKIQDQ